MPGRKSEWRGGEEQTADNGAVRGGKFLSPPSAEARAMGIMPMIMARAVMGPGRTREAGSVAAATGPWLYQSVPWRRRTTSSVVARLTPITRHAHDPSPLLFRLLSPPPPPPPPPPFLPSSTVAHERWDAERGVRGKRKRRCRRGRRPAQAGEMLNAIEPQAWTNLTTISSRQE